MYIKIIGAVFIVYASVFMGFKKAVKLKKRVILLHELETALISIISTLEYSFPTLYECFAEKGEILGAAANLMQSGMTPTEAVIEAGNKNVFIDIEDKRAIEAFATGLNAQDVSGQAANAKLLLSRVKLLIVSAQNDCQSKGKLFKSGGVLLGIALVIILI